MFDNGMTEWAVVLLVALLVLGPQRAMAIIHMAGVMVGKAKAAFAEVQREVEKDLPREEIETLQAEVQQLRKTRVKPRLAVVKTEENQKTAQG